MRRRAQCYASGGRGEATRSRPSAAFLASRVGKSPVSREAQVAAELRRESERKKGKPEGARVKLGEDSSPEGEGCACARFSPPTRPSRPPSRPGGSRAGPVARCLGREERAPCPRAPRRPPLPLVPVRPVATRPLGCRRPGAEASRRQRGHFLTLVPAPAALSTPSRGRPPLRPQDAECD